MKKQILLIAFTAVFSVLSCSKNSLEAIDSLQVEPETATMHPGDTLTLQVSMSPENASGIKTILWQSSHPQTVSVDKNGHIRALRVGSSSITAQTDGLSDSCLVIVENIPPQTGDYYYSDGSWSPELDENKTVIGIVFWCGDPGKDDPLLRQEHPDCVNGLAAAIDGDMEIPWQTGYSEYKKTVGEWIEENAPEYISILSGNGENDNMNRILGYNNTKAIERFNSAPENSAWPVEIVENTVKYRKSRKAPASSSDWYLPSLKELSILCSAEQEGNIWDLRDITSNRDIINARLTSLPGSQPLVAFPYWSSTEGDRLRAYYVNFEIGLPNFSYVKDTWYLRTRCVLAF